MQKKVRWGVIGCGGIAARRTIPEFAKMVSNGELVSVMDSEHERAREVAARFNIPHYCATEEETLNREIDAVYIASPPSFHAAQTVRAASAGKHVLCEKPMALSHAEADRMRTSCAEAGVKFMLAFCMRNNVYHRKARELVRSGALGQVVMGRAQLTCWYPPISDAWRQDISLGGGGSMIDMGTHCLDLLEWIIGSKIVEVCGFEDLLTHRYRTRIEDTSTVLVRLENGAHGVVDNYFNVTDAASLNRLELYGTRGSVLAEGTVGQEPTGKMFSILQAQDQYKAGQVRDSTVERQEYTLAGTGLYGEMVTTFNECILRDEDPPVTATDGLHSVALVDAIYQSGRERRVVTVKN